MCSSYVARFPLLLWIRPPHLQREQTLECYMKAPKTTDRQNSETYPDPSPHPPVPVPKMSLISAYRCCDNTASVSTAPFVYAPQQDSTNGHGPVQCACSAVRFIPGAARMSRRDSRFMPATASARWTQKPEQQHTQTVCDIV